MELINPADFVLTHIFFLSMSILFLLILDTNFCFERHFDTSGHFYFERSENKVTGAHFCFVDKNFFLEIQENINALKAYRYATS